METISWNFSQYKEYIAKLKILEVTNYQLDRLHDELSRKRTQSELQIKNLSAPVSPPNLESVGESLRNGGIFAIVGAILGFILGFIIWAFGGKGFLYNFEHGRDVPIGPYLFTGIIAIATVAFLIGLSKLKGRKRRNAVILHSYYQQEKARVSSIEYYQEIIKQIYLNTQKCEIEQKETRDILKKYYDLNIIHPDYRGLIPICAIYQYLDTQRCYKLTGPDGAYNLYARESQNNFIINKLDEIILHIDELNETQKSLVNEIKKSNNKMDYLVRTLDKIEDNTELSQYYNRITASNTTFMSLIAAFIYDEHKKIK